MVSFSALAASVLAFTSAVHAGFYTTYPVGADAIEAGQTIQITWKADDQAPDLTNVSSYTLKFMTGGNFVQTTVATIGTFDISKTSISFTVPETAPGMYFLMYTAAGDAGSSWSTRFSVGGGTTWYPDGVATGRDPDTSSSASNPGDIGDATDITAEPTSSDKPSSSGHESHSSQGGESSKPSDDNNNNGGDGKDNQSTPSDGPTAGPSASSNGNGDDNNSPTSPSGGDSSVQSSAGNDGSDDSTGDSELGSVSDDESSDDKSSSKDDDSSSSDESSEEDDNEDSTTSAGSVTRILSAAAVVAASIMMI
ncbi:hypothetical protein H4S02_006774 [Coemansia sp. RSA 2611]|nr:hypothetical protein IWW54_002534 [Coemansia sp. RSA 2705]KAJ2380252.1 hypothetical protein H4S02_006774 [Coemansia sp. RSA 2611]